METNLELMSLPLQKMTDLFTLRAVVRLVLMESQFIYLGRQISERCKERPGLESQAHHLCFFQFALLKL